LSYSRFALGFSRSRKISRLSDPAYRLWSSAIDYTREQLTDGFLDEKDLQTIPRGGAGGSWKVAVVTELVTAGLWIRSGSGWQIREFLDWQDSAAQVRAQKDKARERMRSVRANKTKTSPDVPLTDSFILDPDPSSDSDLQSETRLQAAAAGARDARALARVWLKDPQMGGLQAPNPELWPETRALVAVLVEVFGGPEQGPRNSGDPRMKILFERWAEGFTTEELAEAIRGAALDDLVRSKPTLQNLKTILRDAGEVDRYRRALSVPTTPKPAQGGNRAADAMTGSLARLAAAREEERQQQPKALPQ
jgi:hypothetical protein